MNGDDIKQQRGESTFHLMKVICHTSLNLLGNQFFLRVNLQSLKKKKKIPKKLTQDLRLYGQKQGNANVIALPLRTWRRITRQLKICSIWLRLKIGGKAISAEAVNLLITSLNGGGTSPPRVGRRTSGIQTEPAAQGDFQVHRCFQLTFKKAVIFIALEVISHHRTLLPGFSLHFFAKSKRYFSKMSAKYSCAWNVFPLTGVLDPGILVESAVVRLYNMAVLFYFKVWSPPQSVCSSHAVYYAI